MKNVNYNTLKLLHETSDNLWRIEKYYLKDTEGTGCGCGTVLTEMQKDLTKHAEALRAEMAAHVKKDKLA